ncbi:hypothetical protein NB697_001594 [Xanthomonas sacchari]|nr:hypothetical protein [Xanthomonas sacchari]
MATSLRLAALWQELQSRCLSANRVGTEVPPTRAGVGTRDYPDCLLSRCLLDVGRQHATTGLLPEFRRLSVQCVGTEVPPTRAGVGTRDYPDCLLSRCLLDVGGQHVTTGLRPEFRRLSVQRVGTEVPPTRAGVGTRGYPDCLLSPLPARCWSPARDGWPAASARRRLKPRNVRLPRVGGTSVPTRGCLTSRTMRFPRHRGTFKETRCREPALATFSATTRPCRTRASAQRLGAGTSRLWRSMEYQRPPCIGV